MEEVQLLVQEEGRAARHAAFSVPVEPPQALSAPQPEVDLNKAMVRKPPASPRPDSKRDELLPTSRSKKTSESGSQGLRMRSASTGRDKKTEAEHFHWTLLQGNLMRVMEEIFYCCEQSENVDKCKVTMLLLENYLRDFKGLIQYLQVKWRYENTPPPERPSSIAWEVRRTTPSKFFLALKALRPSGNPDEMRACLVDYLAQELNLSTGTAMDVATAVTQSAGLMPTRLNMDETTAKPAVSCEGDHSVSDNEDLAKPLEDDSNAPAPVDNSIVIEVTGIESSSVSSQTDPIGTDENDNTEITNETDVIINKPVKKEESCQTDALPHESYTLDFGEISKPETPTVPTTPVETTPTKPRTPSRLIVVRPSMAAAVARGVTRPLARGRGIITPDLKPGLVQARTVRSVPEPRGSLAVRGLARKTLEPRIRAATTSGTPVKQPTARIGQALATLPNRPNIGVARGLKKLPERVVTKAVARPDSGREAEAEGNLGEQRSNSSSSLNSSSSRSSWADRVRGGGGGNSPLVMADAAEMHSVEDLRRRSIQQAPHEEDGWRMVKARSRSKISPVNKLEENLSRSSTNIKADPERKTSLRLFAQNRFNQPSAARSLPTLALNIVKTSETLERRSSSSKSESSPSNKKSSLAVKSVTKAAKSETKLDGKASPTTNQKKQVNKSPTKIIKQEQSNKKIATVNEQESLEKNKKNLKNESEVTKVLINFENDKSVKENDLPNNLDLDNLDNSEPAASKEGNLSEKGDSDREEEEQRKFDDEVRRKTEELCAEEERLARQIKELETEVDLDNEDVSELEGALDTGAETLHAQYRFMLQDMPLADQRDVLEQLRELEIRHPGRALELHQKLSSPSRRRTLAESLRSFHTKQAKAQEKRAQLMQDKWHKLQELNKKIEEVRAAKSQNTELKREQLELKLKRAEERRNRHLQEIALKAHDEEEKLKEIAFINELEAQNKRHDFMALCQEQEERLQGIQEERQRKQEEKAAKEAAVEERKKILEAERKAKLEEMQERRRRREERIDRELQEKEKERLEMAREKARDREERLQALQAAQLATQEELQKKIQAKQEEYARRHEENMEQIRQRALECCFLRTDIAPRLIPYETHKLCTLCSVLIGSDVYLVSHLRGRQHQEAVKAQLGGKDVTREELEVFSLKHITDAPSSDTDNRLAMDRERQKALKKRCKKIRLRMAAKGQEYEGGREAQPRLESPQRPRLQKCLKDVERLLGGQGRGLWSDTAITALERALAEIGRILDKKNGQDQAMFLALGGFNFLSELFALAMETAPGAQLYLPAKCFATVCNTYSLACSGSGDNCRYVILGNKISTVMDLLLHRLTCAIPTRGRGGGGSGGAGTGGGSIPVDNLAGALMRLLAMLLEHAVHEMHSGAAEVQPQLAPRVQDVVSYAVSAGVLEKLAACCGSVRDPIDEDPPGALFLLAALRLLRALVACARAGGSASVRQDVSQLGATLRVTELVGGVSMLYGMLLHQGAPPRSSQAAPPTLPPHTVAVARATLRLLREVAEMDLALFQGVLGAEGMSLQFRHLASHLLWACSQATPPGPQPGSQLGSQNTDELLQDVIRVVGFFAVRNHDNQMTIQSGFMPTVLQQLCNLPFAFFSEERLVGVLLPTLLACCWDNAETRAVLEQELSFQLLDDFRVSPAGQRDSLVALLGAPTLAN